MDINEMTIGQAKQLVNLFGSKAIDPNGHHLVGQKVLIRSYASGVHVGDLVSQEGQKVVLKNSRRLYYWKATSGISLSEVSKYGIDSKKSKICTVVADQTILDAIEVLSMTSNAIDSIIEAKDFTI